MFSIYGSTFMSWMATQAQLQFCKIKLKVVANSWLEGVPGRGLWSGYWLEVIEHIKRLKFEN